MGINVPVATMGRRRLQVPDDLEAFADPDGDRRLVGRNQEVLLHRPYPMTSGPWCEWRHISDVPRLLRIGIGEIALSRRKGDDADRRVISPKTEAICRCDPGADPQFSPRQGYRCVSMNPSVPDLNKNADGKRGRH